MKTLTTICFVIAFSFIQSIAFGQDCCSSEVYSPDSERTRTQIYVQLPFTDNKQHVDVEIVDGFVIFEGDIVLGKESEIKSGELKGAVRTGKNKHWRDARIPYVIASGHPKKSQIESAIKYINNNTHANLIKRTTQKDYIEFINGSGCWSYVGRQGGKQQISIGAGCSWGNAVHEISHSIGLYHEQSRADRDTYVKINFENIKDGKENNFKKYAVGIDMGPYDYGSIMHYPPYAFSKNAKPTIESKISGKTFGQRIKYSTGDINSVNAALNPDVWHDWFCINSEIPKIGDFNGDGKDDIVTFTRGSAANVYVALSNGKRFNGTGWKWHDYFCYNSEIPLTGDFNGDGKDDIATFTRGTSANVFVALSDGSKFNGTAIKWHDYFCYNTEIPLTGDFNGDGKDDIAAFTRGTAGDVFVALSDGSKFKGTGVKWHDWFCINSEIPLVGDFNGDGKDDIATFTRGSTADVYVALSDGSKFKGTSVKWHNYFCYNTEIPVVADLNKDGKDDIITFTRGSSANVFVAFSNGSKFVGTALKWYDWFANGSHIPESGDFNGDGYDDMVAFSRSSLGDVFVALSGKGVPGQNNQNNAFPNEPVFDLDIANHDVENSMNSSLRVYPNPVTDQANVVYMAEISSSSTLKCYDMTGKLIQQRSLNLNPGVNEFSINLSGLENGFYFMELNQNGKVTREKILLNK